MQWSTRLLPSRSRGKSNAEETLQTNKSHQRRIEKKSAFPHLSASSAGLVAGMGSYNLGMVQERGPGFQPSCQRDTLCSIFFSSSIAPMQGTSALQEEIKVAAFAPHVYTYHIQMLQAVLTYMWAGHVQKGVWFGLETETTGRSPLRSASRC